MDMNLGFTQTILNECRKRSLLRNETAYVLATAFWESGRTMKPVREIGGEKYLKSKKYYPYVGMGFVQLTWLRNYQRASIELGPDFVKNPKLLLEPEHATPILITGMVEGWFTGKKLSDYITLKKSDFANARRIINGTDKAKEIAAIAREYDMDLKVMGYGEGRPASARQADPPPKAVFIPAAAPPAPQVAQQPHVVTMEGPKANETTVAVVATPSNPPINNPTPTSKTGFAVLGAMIVAIGTAAAKYWGG